MKTLGELAALFSGLGLVPLTPALAVSYLGWAWELLVLGTVWACCWYAWLWARTQRRDT